VLASGNGTNTLEFVYSIREGDSIARLSYIDTSSPPYNVGHPASLALQFSRKKQTFGALSIAPLDDMSGGIFKANSKRSITALPYLPFPGAARSLSSESSIAVDTSQPVITKVYSEQPPGVYSAGQEIKIRVRFSKSVVVSGCPRLRLRTNLLEQFAEYSLDTDVPTNELRFVYTIPFGVDVYALDYRDTTSLVIRACSDATDVANVWIRRNATIPLLNADTTLPPVGQKPTVISPTSITAGGQTITLTPCTTAVSQVSVHEADGTYGPGNVLRIIVQFDDPVYFAATVYLSTNIGREAQSIGFHNSSIALFIISIYPGDSVQLLRR
jgi:hypothetical protein